MGRERGGLFLLIPNSKPSPPITVPVPTSIGAAQVSTSNSNNLWHFRLGHLSDSRIKLLQHIIPDCNVVSNKCCSVCPLAKQHRLPFHVSTSISKQSFDLIHCDIWGPFSVKSTNGSQFFLTIVDDYTRFTWVYLMHSKSQTRIIIQNFF